MKNFIGICFAILSVSCMSQREVQTGTVRNVDNVRTSEASAEQQRLTQLDVKMGILKQHIVRMEETILSMAREVRELNQKLQEQSGSSITASNASGKDLPLQLGPLPVLAGKAPNWSAEDKALSKEWVQDFSESEKTVSNPPAQKLIGQTLPSMRFIGSDGEILDLEDYAGKNILLVVLRGFSGSVCLVCSSQTLALADAKEKFAEKNTEVVLIYPGKGDTVSGFLDAVGKLREGFVLPYPIGLDVDLTLVRRLDIEANLAKPTSLIIDKNGVIRYAYIGQNPGDRPAVKELLQETEKIEKLKS